MFLSYLYQQKVITIDQESKYIYTGWPKK